MKRASAGMQTPLLGSCMPCCLAHPPQTHSPPFKSFLSPEEEGTQDQDVSPGGSIKITGSSGGKVRLDLSREGSLACAERSWQVALCRGLCLCTSQQPPIARACTTCRGCFPPNFCTHSLPAPAATEEGGPTEADCDLGWTARSWQDLSLQQAHVLPELVRASGGR